MVFQGGYSPNSIKPLEKFQGINAVQSFNPSGAKNSFNMLLTSNDIDNKFYVGKNVCHGFTKHELSQVWNPEHPNMLEFWNRLADKKAMHDVLAAMCFLKPEDFTWERAKPTWIKNKMTTTQTTEQIWSLIGR